MFSNSLVATVGSSWLAGIVGEKEQKKKCRNIGKSRLNANIPDWKNQILESADWWRLNQTPFQMLLWQSTRKNALEAASILHPKRACYIKRALLKPWASTLSGFNIQYLITVFCLLLKTMYMAKSMVHGPFHTMGIKQELATFDELTAFILLGSLSTRFWSVSFVKLCLSIQIRDSEALLFNRPDLQLML